SSATATTATNSTTYFMNSRLRTLPCNGPAAGLAPVAGDPARARPSGVSGCSEMVIAPLFTKRGRICLLSQGQRSLYYFVGKCQQSWGNLDPCALGNLKVKHEQIMGRLLERQVGRFGAVENAGDQGAGPIERLRQVGPVGHQAAVADQEIELIDRRQFPCRCK